MIPITALSTKVKGVEFSFPKKIGILLICTGKYNVFLQQLVNSLDKYFFVGSNLEIYIFSDKKNKLKISDRISVDYISIEHKPFPYPTLMRYSFFSSASSKINSDYVFYSDVDMVVVDKIGIEILPDKIINEGLVATLHPGFYNGGGAWENNTKSIFYINPINRNKYYAGGFQGGRTKDYMYVCKLLSDNINSDLKKGIIPIWHDESAWNWYLSGKTPKILTPQYCMVEEISKRKKWGISHFKPKIIAIKKNHAKIRN